METVVCTENVKGSWPTGAKSQIQTIRGLLAAPLSALMTTNNVRQRWHHEEIIIWLASK